MVEVKAVVVDTENENDNEDVVIDDRWRKGGETKQWRGWERGEKRGKNKKIK